MRAFLFGLLLIIIIARCSIGRVHADGLDFVDFSKPPLVVVGLTYCGNYMYWVWFDTPNKLVKRYDRVHPVPPAAMDEFLDWIQSAPATDLQTLPCPTAI
jgi:hypothetical protein